MTDTPMSLENVTRIMETIGPKMWQPISTVPENTIVMARHRGCHTIYGEPRSFVPCVASFKDGCWYDASTDDEMQGWDPDEWMPVPWGSEQDAPY